MNRSLENYTRKRHFSETPEPQGRSASKTSRRKTAGHHALAFCIQKHDASHLHYDFRLELDGTLKSWAVPKGPCLDPKVKRLAVHVEDHPLEYASFEGHIPEGHYGAGDVIVWDRGIWTPEGDPMQAYAKGRLTFDLSGEKLSGQWHLVRTRMQGRQEQWFLIKSNDDAAKASDEYDVLSAKPDSVLSDRTLPSASKGGKGATGGEDAKASKASKVSKASDTSETSKLETPAATRTRKAPVKSAAKAKRASSASAEPAESPALNWAADLASISGAKRAALPATLSPELATLVDAAPEGDWRYEIKFDGYRILARIDDGDVRLLTRNGHDWTTKLPRQAAALKQLPLKSGWLDGEVVVANEDGLPDFQALQNAFDIGESDAIVYYLFDLPYANGMDLRNAPLIARRRALRALLADEVDDANADAAKGTIDSSDRGALRYSEDFDASGEAMLDSICSMKLEGIIGKRADSPYRSRRSDDWIKLKCQHRQEFVVVGYTEPKGSRQKFGALLLGLHDAESGALHYAGKVGTGFSDTTPRTVHQRLAPLETACPAVSNPPSGAEIRGVHWLKPTLLAEIAYAEMTRDGSVRHAVFHGLRDDKSADDIAQETPTASRPSTRKQGFRLTHPDRVIDPSSGATKQQLADYYASIADRLLPQLHDRPVALVRAPDGIGGELFFQKHAERLSIAGIRNLEKSFAGQPVSILDTTEALMGAVQMSTIELHTWNASAAHIQQPDRFVLDLDPDPALPWKTMVEATQLTLTVLDELGLKAFLKTSGGKGMHIVVPLTPKAGWDDVKAFSQAIVQHLASHIPARFSAVSGPKNRVGKIFVDYLRNGQGATTIAAFSARTREGLPVSVPIHRDEVSEIKGANQWNIKTVQRYLDHRKDDPWADYRRTRQTITQAMRKRIGMAPSAEQKVPREAKKTRKK